MKKKYTVVILLFLQTLVGFGQINMSEKKGYIITQTNDTVYGEIVEYPVTSLSTIVKFKSNNRDTLIEYHPNDLLGFHIEPDREFTTVSIKERVNERILNTKYFALIAVKGEIEFLVLYLENGKERFFLNNNEFGTTELRQIVKIEEGLKSTDNKYKMELGKYFYKHPGFQKQIDGTNFHYKSLSSLVSNYNLNFEKPSYVVADNNEKWHLHANLGADYYMGEKRANNNEVLGMVLGLKNSLYDETKNLKIEFVFGLNYRFYSYQKNLLYYTNEFGRIIKYPANINMNSTSDGDSSTVYSQKNLLYKERADIIELPVYFEFNNKAKLITPIIQGGFKPYLIKKNMKLEDNGTYEFDWKLTSDFIFAFGLGLNYKRFSFKYLINLDPILMNSCELNFRLN